MPATEYMKLADARQLARGQRVRILVPCIGGDHEGTEHHLPAGSAAVIDAHEQLRAPQGHAITVWIPVDASGKRGIVNVFDESDFAGLFPFEVVR